MRILVVAIVCGWMTIAHAQVFKPRGKTPPAPAAKTGATATTPAAAKKSAPVAAAKKKAPAAKARTAAVVHHSTVRAEDADADETPAPKSKKKSGSVSVKHTSVKDDEAAEDDSDDFTITDD